MKALKTVLLILLNVLPVFLTLLLYPGGIILCFAFIPLQFLAVTANYRFSKKPQTLLLYDAVLLLSTIVSNLLLTRLYCTRVSADAETLAVGNVCLTVGVVFVLVLSILSVVIKFLSQKKKTE